MKKTTHILTVLLLYLSLLLSACNTAQPASSVDTDVVADDVAQKAEQDEQQPQTEENSSSASEGTNDHYPVTVESCGWSVTFDKAPERVVTSYQPATELLIDLGLEDRIVLAGTVDSDPIPRYEEAFKKLEGITVSNLNMTVEQVLEANPDFFISVSPYWDFESDSRIATREEFEEMGIATYGFTTVCTPVWGMGTIEDVYAQVLNLGKIFDVEDRAEELVAEWKGQIDFVQEHLEGVEPVKVSVYGAGEGPLKVYASGFYANIIEMAGGVSNFADVTEDTYPDIGVEAFAERPADVFVISYWEGSPADEKAEFLFNTFPNMPASQEQKWIPITNVQLTPSGSNSYTVEQLARFFHPEAFE